MHTNFSNKKIIFFKRIFKQKEKYFIFAESFDICDPHIYLYEIVDDQYVYVTHIEKIGDYRIVEIGTIDNHLSVLCFNDDSILLIRRIYDNTYYRILNSLSSLTYNLQERIFYLLRNDLFVRTASFEILKYCFATNQIVERKTFPQFVNLVSSNNHLILVENRRLTILDNQLRKRTAFYSKGAEQFLSCALTKKYLVGVEFNMTITIFEKGTRRLIQKCNFQSTEVERGIFVLGNSIYLPSCKYFGQFVHIEFSRRRIFLKGLVDLIEVRKFTEKELIERDFNYFILDGYVIFGSRECTVVKRLIK